MTGDEALAEFGALPPTATACGIGSPAAGAAGSRLRAGEVRLVNTSRLVAEAKERAALDAHDLPLRALLQPDGDGARRARFGRTLRFIDVDGDDARELLVGAPLADANRSAAEAGAAYVWRGGDALPTGTVST